MNIKSLYDTVVLRSPCSHNEFLTHLDTTVRTLSAQFGSSYVITSGTYGIPRYIDSDIPVYDAYYPAICSNILFLLTGDADRKTDYVAESDAAYKSVWSGKAKGRTLRDRGYYHV